MDDRDRLAPVTLAGEYPVTQLIIHRLLAQAALLNHSRSFLLEYGGLHSIPLAGINHDSAGLSVSLRHILDFFSILGDYLDNRNVEFFSKFKVTVIVSRYAHDCARTIVGQYIVGEPDRCLSPV